MSVSTAMTTLQPAAACCAQETVLAMAQPARARCQTCSRWCQADARQYGLISRCIQRSDSSCGAAHSSLHNLRLLARVTQRCLARVAGPLDTSIRSTRSRRWLPDDVAMLIVAPGGCGVCGCGTERWPQRSIRMAEDVLSSRVLSANTIRSLT